MVGHPQPSPCKQRGWDPPTHHPHRHQSRGPAPYPHPQSITAGNPNPPPPPGDHQDHISPPHHPLNAAAGPLHPTRSRALPLQRAEPGTHRGVGVPCPSPAAPGCTSCTAGGRRTPAAPAAARSRGAAPGNRRWVPAVPLPSPLASGRPAAVPPRCAGEAWPRDLQRMQGDGGEAAAWPRVPRGKCWNLLHSLRFKSRRGDVHGEGALPGDPFVRAEPASARFALPLEPRRAWREQQSQARTRRGAQAEHTAALFRAGTRRVDAALSPQGHPMETPVSAQLPRAQPTGSHCRAVRSSSSFSSS